MERPQATSEAANLKEEGKTSLESGGTKVEASSENVAPVKDAETQYKEIEEKLGGRNAIVEKFFTIEGHIEDHQRQHWCRDSLEACFHWSPHRP